MNVESAGSWLIDVGTVTVALRPVRSTATMAVKIFVRLAGAQAGRVFDCQMKRPVSRFMSATSWASIAGTGIGGRVGSGRATAGVLVGEGDGVGGGLAVAEGESARGRWAGTRSIGSVS